MKEKGMGDARIGQETNQMQNFLYLLLKKRFDAIVESKNLFFIYSQGSNGIGLLTTEIGDSVCVVDKLTEVDIRNYTSTRLPSWIKPDSNFAKAVEEYRKTLSYGVTAFGKMSNGNTFIVLSLPRYKPGAYGGPVPYLFAGVVLVGNETKEHKPAVFGNLMHVQYGVSFHPDHIGK